MSNLRRVRVGIVDSGITPGHQHVGPVAGGVSLVPSGPSDDIVDRLGHGTAVAGAIREAAPEADLYAIKVFDRRLSTTVETLLAAVKWCAENAIDLVNLSLGTGNMQYRDRFAQILNGEILAVSVAGMLPGCLAGVIAVEGDKTCPRGSFRVQNDTFLTSPYARPIPGVPMEHNLQGSSFAVANMTGIVARVLADTPRHQAILRLRQEVAS